MHLLRCLWLFVVLYDIDIVAEHIAGATNQVANMLSRNQTDLFLCKCPQVSRLPTPLPLLLLLIVSCTSQIGHLIASGSASEILSQQYSPINQKYLCCRPKPLQDFLLLCQQNPCSNFGVHSLTIHYILNNCKTLSCYNKS